MNNDGPSVSIIVAVRNGSGYLESFKHSIGNIRGRGIELVIVDDASTDTTSQILQCWEGRITSDDVTDLQVLTRRLETPAGVAQARKIGAQMATKEWLWFVDVDDGLPADWFATVTRLVEESANADVLVAQATLLHRGQKERLAEYSRSSLKHRGSVSQPAILMVLEGRILGYLWDKLFRRDWFLSHLDELLNLRTHSDLYWILRLFSSSPATHASTEILYNYRLDYGSLSFKPEASTADFLECARLAERISAKNKTLTLSLDLFLGRFIGLAALDDLIQKRIGWREVAEANQIRNYLTLTSIYKASLLRPGSDGLRMALAYIHPMLYVATGRSARALLHALRRVGSRKSSESTLEQA